MASYVVDTNVPVVANGNSPQADPDCVIACVDLLSQVRNDGLIVLDDAMRILDEYRRNLGMKGQPGPGGHFMKWVWNVQADRRHCRQVHLTPRADDPDDFEEIPRDAALAGFDRSDRKFLAVAMASSDRPVVVNAVDSDWRDYYPSLRRHGVSVTFLCPQHVCSS